MTIALSVDNTDTSILNVFGRDMRFPTTWYVRSEKSQSVKLLTEHHLEFLSLKGGCTFSYESALSKYHIAGNHMSWLICC